jgi:L-alanine-DL-glutamate epimerase-like enolase superfamily enzyme
MEMILRVYDLPLKHRFTISRQSYEKKRTLIVELKEGGISGFGEASENPYYHKSIEDMVQDLIRCSPIIQEIVDDEPENIWNRMHAELSDNMFALAALDIAYHDLYARKRGKKLFQLWGLDIRNNPLSNYTLGIDSIEGMLLKMKETPWPIYKIKLGTDRDLEIVKALREHSDAVFRIDANCAWDVETTLKNAREFIQLGVEFIEQPLSTDDREGNQWLYAESPIPIIADESCQVERDVDLCFNQFHGINVKLVKCGGITPARRMLARAGELGMKKMVGCMTESSVGISAIAHLLPMLDYADLDGAYLLERDIADGVVLKKGEVVYADQPGMGATLRNKNTNVTFSSEIN